MTRHSLSVDIHRSRYGEAVRRRWPMAALSMALLTAVSACRQATDNTIATSNPRVPAVTVSRDATDATDVTDSTNVTTSRARAPEPEVQRGASVSGTLEATTRAVLRAELAGPVQRLDARVGDRITAGKTLAVLSVPAVQASHAAATAQVAASESARRQVTHEHERVAQLLAVGGASRAELDDLDARVRAVGASVAAAQAALAVAEADLARRIVRAPFDGIIERRAVTAGSTVQVGDELVTVVDPRALELEGGVAMAHAAALRVGARVSLRISGWSEQTLTGRVVRIAPTLDRITRQLRVTIALANADGRIPVGAFAEGLIITNGR